MPRAHPTPRQWIRSQAIRHAITLTNANQERYDPFAVAKQIEAYIITGDEAGDPNGEPS